MQLFLHLHSGISSFLPPKTGPLGHFCLHCFRLKRSQSSPPSARFSLYMFPTVCALLHLLVPAIRKQDSLPRAFYFSYSTLLSILSSLLCFFTLPLHCSLIGFFFLFLIFYSRSRFATPLIRSHRACLTEAEIKHHELEIGHDTYLIAPGVSHVDSEPGFPPPSHLIRSTPSHL